MWRFRDHHARAEPENLWHNEGHRWNIKRTFAALPRKGEIMATATELHRKAITADLETIASTLVDVMGRALVAGIVGIRNPKTISRWANGEVTSVRNRYSEERLIATYQVVILLQEHYGSETIRSFMLGMNPVLNDESPAVALRDGDFKGAMNAARNFLAGGY